VDVFRRGETPAALGSKANYLLELLVAASLPSAPMNVRTVTVGIVEEELARNESQPLMRVDIHNLNVAQPLIVSKQGVTPLAGIQILARTTRPFVLPRGSALFGIINLGTILVTVAEGYDFQPAVYRAIGSTGG
jgi:hypothetical protein